MDFVRTASIFLIISSLSSAPASADSSRPLVTQPRALAPQAFRDVPTNVVEELALAGCTIPQTTSKKPHNLIRGQFVEAGQYDWAALCSRGAKSSIVLVSSRKGRCPEYALRDDSVYLQQVDNGKIEYSREIRRQSKVQLTKRLTDQPESSLKNVDHDGIEDAFLGKASTIYYCKDGKWSHINGAD